MKNKLERRMVSFSAPENENGEMIIEGTAIPFDTPQTHKIGDVEFTETISARALEGTDMKDVPLRYNHKDGFLIMARTRNNSLELVKDAAGLHIRAKLIDTQSNADIYKSIQSGLITQMSFAFSVPESGDEWEFDGNRTKRSITNIDRLFDVSVVDTPFYEDTAIYARSLDLLEGKRAELDSLQCKLLKEKIRIGGLI